jgi:hypothetical protein
MLLELTKESRSRLERAEAIGSLVAELVETAGADARIG